jgi:hypothetical protein
MEWHWHGKTEGLGENPVKGHCKDTKLISVLDKITSYKRDWVQHINRMPRSRLPNLLTKYAPRGIRNQGRPLKRLLEEWDRNRPAMVYFPESEVMTMMMTKSTWTDLGANAVLRGFALFHSWPRFCSNKSSCRMDVWVCTTLIVIAFVNDTSHKFQRRSYHMARIPVVLPKQQLGAGC